MGRDDTLLRPFKIIPGAAPGFFFTVRIAVLKMVVAYQVASITGMKMGLKISWKNLTRFVGFILK